MLRFNRWFLGALAGFFSFSVAFGGNLPFYIFYSLMLIFLLSTFYISLIISRFSIETAYQAKMLQAGDSARILVKFNFDIWLPVPYVEIRGDIFAAGAGASCGHIRSTAWDENIWIENSICFHQRGIHSLNDIQVTVKDLFHVVRYERNFQTGILVTVYPRLFPIKPVYGGGTDVYRNSVNLRGRSEDPFTIKDIRKYREGDSLKKIHWRLSAKHDDLLVRNPSEVSGDEVNLLIDMHASNYSWDTEGFIEESLVDMALSIVSHMIKKNINVKVYLNAASAASFHICGPDDLARLSEYFLHQKSDGCIEFVHFIGNCASGLHRMNKLLLITASINKDLADGLMAMSNSGYSADLFYCIPDGSPETLRLLRDNQVGCHYFRDFIVE